MNSPTKYIFTTISLIISSIIGTGIGIMNSIFVSKLHIIISTNAKFAFVILFINIFKISTLELFTSLLEPCFFGFVFIHKLNQTVRIFSFCIRKE